MATKPVPTGLSDEQAAILTPGNFVLHAVYQSGTDGYTRGAIYQPLYVVGVNVVGEKEGLIGPPGTWLDFISEPVGRIRSMRALNLFENAPKNMPPKVITAEEADTYISFSSAVGLAATTLAMQTETFKKAEDAMDAWMSVGLSEVG